MPERVIVDAVRAKLKGSVLTKGKTQADGSSVWAEGSTVLDADTVFVSQKARDFMTRVRHTSLGRVAKMDPENTGALIVDIAIWTVVDR